MEKAHPDKAINRNIKDNYGDMNQTSNSKLDFEIEIKETPAGEFREALNRSKMADSGQDGNGSGEPHDSNIRHDTTLPAPDGGYGWFVVLSCFMSHVIMGGLDRSDGIFYLQFVDKFQQNALLTSWSVSLTSTLRLTLGPVASAFATRYSVRTSCMIGTTIVVLCFIFTAFIDNIFLLFPFYSVLQGIGRSLIYGPGLVIVGMYFNKRRSLAAGISASGVGFGTFAIVPLIQFLFDTYGYTGAFIVLAGLTSNFYICSMLNRPLSFHHLMVGQSKNQREQSMEVGQDLPLTENLKDKVDGTEAEGFHQTSRVSYRRTKHTNFIKSSVNILFPVEKSGKKDTKKTKLFNFALLKNPSFLFYCFSICLFTLAFKAGFTFLPALIKSKGLSEQEAALILSISGIVETAGRILAGFILDLPSVRVFRPAIYNSFPIFVAISALFLPFMSSFATFALLTSVYACFTGAYVSQKSVVVVDILGPEHLASSFGILISFQGLGTLVGPPVSGAFKDYFGTYDEAFYLGAGMVTIGFCFMILSNVCKCIDKRRAKKHSVSVNGYSQ